MASEIFGLEDYAPREIFHKVENVGVTKARLPLVSKIALGMLAGVFIGLGALYYTLITSEPSFSFITGRLLGGLAFSLGLILVVVAGAELFTGNNLLVMAWASKKISTCDVLCNWLVIWISNFIGAIGLVVLVVLAHHGQFNQGAVAAQAVKIASLKVSLPFAEAFFKGILCNLLVCLAVWLAMAGHSVVDKIVAIVFPISAFVAAGFEHSVANMYFIPLGILLRSSVPADVVPLSAMLNLKGMFMNLIPVTLGNIVGGGVMVALVYFMVYRPGKVPGK